jgi:hypothetical protein
MVGMLTSSVRSSGIDWRRLLSLYRPHAYPPGQELCVEETRDYEGPGIHMSFGSWSRVWKGP